MQKALPFLLILLALPATAQNDAALEGRLRSAAQGFHGKLSLYAHDLVTGHSIAIDADQPVPTASVIKLGILYTALEQIRAGRAHFDDRLTLRKQDQVAGSGVLLFFDTPMTLTLKDALTMMIAESDNTATNLVIDRLGLRTIDDQIDGPVPQGLGMKNTWLYKKIEQPAEGPMPADQKQFGLGKTTAREMASLMERFVTCDLGPSPVLAPGPADARSSATPPPAEATPGLSRASARPSGEDPSDKNLCETAMHMLKSQIFRNSIPRYLEMLDTTEGESAIANKTGALDHVRNDVGAVFTKQGTIVISEFTHDNRDTIWTPDNEAEVLMAKFAKEIVNEWAPESSR